MNRKYLLIGLAVALVAGLAWTGRTIYRAKRNLVTIDVYNAPLAEVIRQMEKQTRETIIASQGLDAKVTFAVKNMPLDQALDKLGEQAGAMWSKWYAVHDSGKALNQLETALRNRTNIEDAGWTNIAPQDFSGGPMDGPSELTGAGGKSEVVVTRGQPMVVKLNKDDVKGGDVQAAVAEKLRAAGADEDTIAKAGAAMKQQTVDVDVKAGGGGGGNMIIRRGSGGPDAQPRIRMVTRTRDGNGQVTEEVWSPEHVVLEQRLRPKLAEQTYDVASEAVAREVAQLVKGDLTPLYVLRKSPGGFPMAGRVMRKVHSGPDGIAGTNGPGSMPPMPDIESVVKRAEAENYTRLTPEQRVQRAREKQAAKQNP